jgi:hypothetical protein
MTSSQPEYYVYLHKKADSLDVFYVGKGKRIKSYGYTWAYYGNAESSPTGLLRV